MKTEIKRVTPLFDTHAFPNGAPLSAECIRAKRLINEHSKTNRASVPKAVHANMKCLNEERCGVYC